MRVSKYLNKITKPFHHNNSQSFQVLIPIQGGHISTTFEQNNLKDINAEILSLINFPNKGTVITKAYSDDACKITYISPKTLSPVKIASTIVLSDDYPLSFKASYLRPIRSMLSFKQSTLISISCKNPFNKSNFKIHTNSQFFNPLFSLRLGFFNDSRVVSLEAFWNKFCKIGSSIVYNYDKKRVADAQIVTGFDIKDTKLGFSASFIERSISLSAIHKLDAKTKVGALVGVENIGYETDKILSISARRFLDDNSKIKVFLKSNKVLSSTYNIKFQDFLEMTFSGKLDYSTEEAVTQFGANVVFDLSKRHNTSKKE